MVFLSNEHPPVPHIAAQEARNVPAHSVPNSLTREEGFVDKVVKQLSLGLSRLLDLDKIPFV
jgi:hypothetical protein